jgi:hypothetical protein
MLCACGEGRSFRHRPANIASGSSSRNRIPQGLPRALRATPLQCSVIGQEEPYSLPTDTLTTAGSPEQPRAVQWSGHVQKPNTSDREVERARGVRNDRLRLGGVTLVGSAMVERAICGIPSSRGNSPHPHTQNEHVSVGVGHRGASRASRSRVHLVVSLLSWLW